MNKRAAALRLLALECRAIADTFSTPVARAQMQRIADSYDDMARTLDDLAEHERLIALAAADTGPLLGRWPLLR